MRNPAITPPEAAKVSSETSEGVTTRERVSDESNTNQSANVDQTTTPVVVFGLTDDPKDAEIKRLIEESETKSRIIDMQNEKIAELERVSDLTNSKNDLMVQYEGDQYIVADGVTKSIYHNQVIVKVADFTEEEKKFYIENGFLKRV